MSTIVPLPVLVTVALVAGVVVAWVLSRRDSGWAEVVEAPPGSVLVLDELGTLRDFAERAQVDPALRQDWVDEVFSQLRDTSHWAELWQLLTSHLRPGTPGFWPGLDLRAESQVLAGTDLRGCEVRAAVFREVRFWGGARFDGLVCTGPVGFERSAFTYHASFRGTEFRAGADFAGTTFMANTSFAGVTAGDRVRFDEVRFSGRTDFTGAEFAAGVSFVATGFAGPATFRDARFAAEARFPGTRFSSHADFTGATAGAFHFAGASARTEVRAVRTWPDGVSLEEPQRTGHWAEVREV
ncbi:pentapeptide repeat-containing protein [Amycolatopsis sp. WQ 127309]|uniref:pentapeptide repeat-containing protein n=1 Tax=Amycolatopsis sp. WQ 127309 TaxID=2932773 RepID=UPI001FF61D44|nr:pentapeptide repeat-containing protein [Amycolatopsis sp. WQ 127309]UOZ05129.1 pentapeptide repeat-containing protein [Amycolatopsis sp. WQ 127309]